MSYCQNSNNNNLVKQTFFHVVVQQINNFFSGILLVTLMPRRDVFPFRIQKMDIVNENYHHYIKSNTQTAIVKTRLPRANNDSAINPYRLNEKVSQRF